MDPKLAWLATNFIAAFLLPPLSLILLMLAGMLLLKRKPFLGKTLIAAGLGLLYALSMPLVAGLLFGLLQPAPFNHKTDIRHAGAIVVLGAGRYEDAPEYGGDTASPLALERLRYAAALHRQTGLPLLVTGGAPDGGLPEAQFMREILEREFKVPVRWTESASRNTRENALFSRDVLAKENIHRILLVTHAWHMPRAQTAFERAGFDVIPAGTRFVGKPEYRLLDFIPDASALRSSSYALHEFIGIVWYKVRG